MYTWSFKIKINHKIIETYVYSELGTDIKNRFPNYEITSIRKLDFDPTLEMKEELI
jgi:hypothetical protein